MPKNCHLKFLSKGYTELHTCTILVTLRVTYSYPDPITSLEVLQGYRTAIGVNGYSPYGDIFVVHTALSEFQNLSYMHVTILLEPVT